MRTVNQTELISPIRNIDRYDSLIKESDRTKFIVLHGFKNTEIMTHSTCIFPLEC